MNKTKESQRNFLPKLLFKNGEHKQWTIVKLPVRYRCQRSCFFPSSPTSVRQKKNQIKRKTKKHRFPICILCNQNVYYFFLALSLYYAICVQSLFNIYGQIYSGAHFFTVWPNINFTRRTIAQAHRTHVKRRIKTRYNNNCAIQHIY